ncbi:MAG TPA: hypothetical protein VE961_01495 [Pyrinomonadaceae bacterium]|nr:hypothetical protein [Pyrinomonadaceae bacterium]
MIILRGSLLACLIIAGSSPAISQARKPPVTAAQINGLYTFRHNDFRVLALGHNKIKVQFNGEWMTMGGYPNIGEAIGEAAIDGNVAIFIPGDTTKCKITMTFLTNKMVVQQEGNDAECGFGHNVMATGTYRRVKAGKPKFIKTPQ